MKILNWLDHGDVIRTRYFILRIYRNQNMTGHFAEVREGKIEEDKLKGWVLQIVIYKCCIKFFLNWIT